MGDNNLFDINLNFLDELKELGLKGEDPDKYSKTLKRYHKQLWHKKLPNNDVFLLEDAEDSSGYLVYKTEKEIHKLSSDLMINSYAYDNEPSWSDLKEMIKPIAKEDIDKFNKLTNTIGSFIIFPHNMDGGSTMNQARCYNNPIIHDRFDLTLECIRRYYLPEKQDSPLKETIERYHTFFDLFGNFEGYCDFFLLQDLVTSDYSKINFFLEFDNFEIRECGEPQTLDEYKQFMERSSEFIHNRNKSMLDFIKKNELNKN